MGPIHNDNRELGGGEEEEKEERCRVVANKASEGGNINLKGINVLWGGGDKIYDAKIWMGR